MNITHCSTEEVERRVHVLSLKAVVECGNEAAPNIKGVCLFFLTLNLNDEDACSLHAAGGKHLHTQRNNRI